MSDKEHAAPEKDKAAEKKSGGLGSKLMVVGFMGIVVMVEVVAAYCLIPSAEHVAQLAKEKMAKELPSTLAHAEESSKEEKNPVIEVDLGQYSVTASQAEANVALRIDFHLYGTVLEKDESETSTLFERHTHRFRDQVLYEIRNADLTDLNDPGLGLIKRRILEKSNALFGKPLLRTVVFSDFSFIEQ